MTLIGDGYEGYYAARLWTALPGVYRAQDTPGAASTAAGPLRELVDRIGAQMAVVRRSIDRLWADQSIETCSDWVIPYIGALLGTNLVNAQDTSGQRLDVAKTIHYRRRKGTVQVLEELATDVTGWDAVVVEGFRRMARTRHGLDPAVGAAAFPTVAADDVPAFLATEGLVGTLTGTPAGGTLDLRDAHGASLVGSAFDEAFHFADVRAGQGVVGHFTVPKLLVFLWRLQSYPVPAGTPVARTGCPAPTYTFDPTGRSVPLFLPPAPPAVSDPDQADFVSGGSDTWAPASEWQVPGPLTNSLLTSMQARGVATTGIYAVTSAGAPADVTSVAPEVGQFTLASSEDTAAPTVQYCYGFSAAIGAGTYSRPTSGSPVTPVSPTVSGGGPGLGSTLAAAPATGTVVVGDSLTYDQVADVGSTADPVVNLVVTAADETRPVVRPSAGGTEWVFTGGGQAELVLSGLLVSGVDIVLRGSFASVTITNCTFDPGATAEPPAAAGQSPVATAADGRALTPVTVWVEADPAQPPGQGGAVATLTVTDSIVGPIRTRYDGAVQQASVTSSVVQAIPTTNTSTYTAGDVYDPVLLAQGLTSTDPLAAALLAKMSAADPTVAATLQTLATEGLAAAEGPLPDGVLSGLNALVADAALVDATTVALFEAAVTLGPSTAALLATVAADVTAGRSSSLSAADQATLNRALVDATFPVALGLSTLALAGTAVTLTEVTAIGPLYAHQLSLSDSVVTGVIAVDDVQQGCVRFSAVVTGSQVPRQYESVLLEEDAPLFVSTAYGQPGYAQLLDSADQAVLSGSQGTSVSTGADNGSEMGAFNSLLNPVKEQALGIKYGEYMPLGLTPVLVHVT